MIEQRIIHNRNRVEIQKICPIISQNELNITNTNSILGISIATPASTGNKISAIFDFLNRRGLTVINLMIGDSLYKYTAMIKYRCNENEAKNLALEHSKNLTQHYISYMNDFEKSFRLNFLFSSVIEKEEYFHIYYENIWNLFETNMSFRESILNFSEYYLSRVLDVESALDNNFKQCAYKYLIEELAIFAILNQKGFNILIYPGVIQTIYDIITMKHPYLSKLFKDYIFVSLRLTRN